jgi:hypothetical protein
MNKVCAKMVQKCFRSKELCLKLSARLLEETDILVKKKILIIRLWSPPGEPKNTIPKSHTEKFRVTETV